MEIDSRRRIAEIWQDVARACDVGESALAEHVAVQLALTQANLAVADGPALKLVPKRLDQRYQVFPLRQDDRRIVVATADPTNLEVEQAIAFSSGRSVAFEVAPPADIDEAIELLYSAERDIESFLRGMGVDVTTGVSVEERVEPEAVSDAEVEAEPTVQLTNVILAEAVRRRASDIHIEPTPHGGIVRLLDPKGIQRLPDLALPDSELSRIRTLLAHREGIVLVTGPTGSGKTTTLYAALAALATGRTNIMTIEDPVEYRLPGVTQIEVETKRNVTFAAGLRAILRQDPDVILVGEIRDGETAEVAAKAAMTGHLVLATLHANDPVGAVDRLRTLDLDRATIAATLRGSLAQRLVRRVCPKCCEPVEGAPTADESRLMARYQVTAAPRAVGCAQCDETGYLGRLPLVEVFAITRDVSEMIAKGATSAELERAASAGGMRDLHQVARDWIQAVQLTLQESDRVLGDLGEPAAPLAAAAPPADGRQVLHEVRHAAATVGLPVLVLTGTEGDESEVELMEAGADDYLRKPFDPSRLLARVRAVLRRASA